MGIVNTANAIPVGTATNLSLHPSIQRSARPPSNSDEATVSNPATEGEAEYVASIPNKDIDATKIMISAVPKLAKTEITDIEVSISDLQMTVEYQDSNLASSSACNTARSGREQALRGVLLKQTITGGAVMSDGGAACEM
jgi:hypothetical protein